MRPKMGLDRALSRGISELQGTSEDGASEESCRLGGRSWRPRGPGGTAQASFKLP